MRNNDELVVRGAIVKFRNFSGAPGLYNKAGDRNFCLFPGVQVAEELGKLGWNIKWTKAKPEYPDVEPEPYIEVAVQMKPKSPRQRPPKVVLISNEGRKQTILEENEVHLADWAEMENVDLIVTPSYWEKNGRSGIKAYLKSIYITVYEDPLEKIYNNVPESALSLIREDEDY